MYLIAGLGNPGDKYTNNRHNVGFLFLDYLKLRNSFDVFKKKDNYKFSKGTIDGVQVVLLKPQTFMNLSGQAITRAMSFFKIPLSNVIVAYDDIALPFSNVRIRASGSAGGHNGLKNIEKELGTKDYKRIRFGVDAPEYPGMLIDFVLGDFDKTQLEKLNSGIFDEALRGLSYILKDDIGKAMNEINRRDNDKIPQ